MVLPWEDLKTGILLQSPAIVVSWSISPRDGEILFHMTADSNCRPGVDWTIQAKMVLPGGIHAYGTFDWVKGMLCRANFALITKEDGRSMESVAMAMRHSLLTRYGPPSNRYSDCDLGGEESWEIDHFCVRLGWYYRQGRYDYLRVDPDYS